MRGGLKMEAYDLENCIRGEGEPFSEKAPQKGSMILEAIIVLGMIATFTPLLYKHVADRRADIENINRANTLIYLQQKTEEYLKDPDNITDLVNELGHNQHKEIFPSELGIGDNFDGRYIIGIRREDEQNKPVLKAMIIDTVNTGSDLRAAKVAELIGISAGIYTAVDPDAAWGINGTWSEPLSRYFTTTDIPTGAVAVTTEYNKEKYRVSMSDIVVDSDLDMGEFELTAEQINAINLAAQSGTIDQITATDVRASNKVVAGTKLCVGGEEAENCIESWEGLGGGGEDTSDLMLVQLCNAGMTESCALAFTKDLNTSCSKIDAVYNQFGQAYPTPKVYSITYGTGGTYDGSIRVKCEGTSFVVDNISTATLTNPVEQVGDTAFGITTPGWYQITLMGEAGYWTGYTSVYNAAGGILIANTYYDADTIITLKGIKGYVYSSTDFGGAGVALWDTINATETPILAAGGGACGSTSGGGYIGGKSTWTGNWTGYSWDGSLGTNTTYCNSATCNIGATGGMWWDSRGWGGYGGTGYCGSGYTCTTITGGNATVTPYSYPASTYGNWGMNTLTGGKGYASIRWCGPSGSASSCPDTCSTDSDCPSATPYCNNGFCGETKSCSTDSDCPSAIPYCDSGSCAATKSCTSSADCTLAAQPYCFAGSCSSEQPCLIASDCPSNKPYCNSGACSATSIITCGSTSTMASATWVAGWANCTTCSAGQFKKDSTAGNNTSWCAYPVASASGCVNIPAVNSYTIMPTDKYWMKNSYVTVSNANMWHRQVNITCNGKNEEWDLIGPFPDWWEAVEICGKLGKVLPANTDVLTGGCTEGARWSLIANATAVGTNQTLTEVSGINSSYAWDSSTGNVTSSPHSVWTQRGWGSDVCHVWVSSLSNGSVGWNMRSGAGYNFYTLCGPAN